MGILWFLKLKNQIKRGRLILTALTNQITIVVLKGWWPVELSWPSRTGHHLWLWQKPAPDPDSQRAAQREFQPPAEPRPPKLLCFGLRLHFRNDKSAFSNSSVNMTECSWLWGGSRKRRQEGTLCWASRNRIFLPGWSPGSSHRIFNLLQAD